MTTNEIKSDALGNAFDELASLMNRQKRAFTLTASPAHAKSLITIYKPLLPDEDIEFEDSSTLTVLLRAIDYLKNTPWFN